MLTRILEANAVAFSVVGLAFVFGTIYIGFVAGYVKFIRKDW